jgi:hypothetical protein
MSGIVEVVFGGLAAADPREGARCDVAWAGLDVREGQVVTDLACRVSCSHGRGVRVLT